MLPSRLPVNARPGEVLGPALSPNEAACGQVVACQRGAIVLLEVEREDGIILKGRSLSEQSWEGKIWHNE